MTTCSGREDMTLLTSFTRQRWLSGVTERLLSQRGSWILAAALTVIASVGGQGVLADGAGNVDIRTNEGCMQDAAGFALNCTAEDIKIITVSNIVINDDGCVAPGDTVDFTADFTVEVNATSRYDIGLWFSEDGDPNADGSYTGACSVVALPYAPDPPWLDLDTFSKSCDYTGGYTGLIPTPALGCSNNNDCWQSSSVVCDQGPDDPPGTTTCSNDRRIACDPIPPPTLASQCDFGACKGPSVGGDTCGDLNTGHNPVYPEINLVVTCADTDASGTLDLPYCSSWRISGANELCTSPVQAYPANAAKCKCDPGFDVGIPVPSSVCKIVRLHANTGGWLGSASFDATYAPPNYTLTLNTADGIFAGNGLVYNDGQFPLDTVPPCDDPTEQCLLYQSTFITTNVSDLTGWVLGTVAGAPPTGNTITFTGSTTYSYSGSFGAHTGTYTVQDCSTAVPEPGTLVLMGLPLGGLVFARRRRKGA